MVKKLFFLFGTGFIVILLLALIWPAMLWLLVILLPTAALGLFDVLQTHHTLWRNFPITSHGRWLMEFFRPFLRQYFFESETSGTPISRMFRSVIYRRAKGDMDTEPYGTKLDTQRIGYEWIGHSIASSHIQTDNPDPRIVIGGRHCKHPYSASIFNISAMSFGALSDNAIRALNKGAAIGGFFHNSGEGGISPYHLEHGGDLVWEIGTGYFGCRDQQGNFCAEQFQTQARHKNIKMIEIKLSQGAKPGHGGILPADKNSPEIARIRLVEAGTTVKSPATHSAFNSPMEMMAFIQQLRDLSGGKPIGFKLALGRKSEFTALCMAMVESNIMPDFITVDGGEGGTGAAPLEYSNSVGMPLREALAFVCDTLLGFNLKQHIKVIASGKVFTGFHLVKNFALGADACNSARGMMIALGCVQSLTCNTNKCPTGIATQNPKLSAGLVVENKAERVARFHRQTVKAVMEIVASAGLDEPAELNRTHIHRRTSETTIKRYDEIYPYPEVGCLLNDNVPDYFATEMSEACAHSFKPNVCIAEGHEGLTEVDN